MPTSSNGSLTYAERKRFKLGKLLAIVEDVFNEPDALGRGALTRAIQPASYDFSLGTNWRIGWLKRGSAWSFYAQGQKLDNSALPDKKLSVYKAGNSVRYLVKKLQLYPKNVQDTCMYAFRSATVFVHWQYRESAAYAAWLHPTQFSDTDWYFLGSEQGTELALLDAMRTGEIDITGATHTLI